MRNVLSVIIPAYNEELLIEKAYSKINDVLNNAGIPHEIIFIDDGSKDKSFEIIKKLSAEHNNAYGVKFSRNFGKESAIYAGLTVAKDSACCVVIDCDLQHPPEKIVEMYRLWEEGYEIVEGVKSDRGKESPLHAFCAKSFYSIMSNAVKIDMKSASDFKLLDSKAIITLVNMKEKNAFFRALSSWIGFKTTKVEFEVREREAGSSKWSTKNLIKYALNNITSFSSMPIHLLLYAGMLMFGVSIVLGIIAITQKIIGVASVGFTTVILLQLFSSSLIMMGLGIIGYYIQKIYEEVQQRPKFIISQICGGEKNDKEAL